MNYVYKAKVVDVHDGDTITVDIDLGLFVTAKSAKVRLWGINTPELSNQPFGQQSRDALIRKVKGKQVVIQTFKDDKEKYGRWLAIVWLGDVNINDWLVTKGLAVNYMRVS